MAVYRGVPECPFCGKVIAKAIYRDDSNLPIQLRLIGDNFIEWEYDKHECEGLKKMANDISNLKNQSK